VGVVTLWLGALGALAAIGAGLDAFTRRLPNILCLVMLVTGLGLAFAMGGWTALGLHFAHAALALVVGYLLFMAGIFGGGDGKFYAAVASFYPLWEMLGLFVAITFAGFFLAVSWLTLKHATGLKKRLKGDFAKLPYGVAIAIGAVGYAFWMSR